MKLSIVGKVAQAAVLGGVYTEQILEKCCEHPHNIYIISSFIPKFSNVSLREQTRSNPKGDNYGK